MSRINVYCVSAAIVTFAVVTEVQAASLYTTRCDALTGTAVSDPTVQVLNVLIEQREGTPPGSERERREHVRISPALATALGLTAGDVAPSGEAAQIRVSLGGGSPIPTANFTVSAIDPDAPANALTVEVWLPDDLDAAGDFEDRDNGFFKLFGFQDPSAVFAANPTGKVHGMAPSATFIVDGGAVTRYAHFTEPNASSSKQFRECLELRGDDRLAVLVPHGGGIETKISDELDTLLTDLDTYGYEPSVWESAGQWGGTTFPRWHVTATQISGDSFPGYGELEDSGTYQYGLALHGFSHNERAVVMGGRASRQVKCYMLKTIEDFLYWKFLDEKITYKIFAPDGAPVDVVRESTGSGDNPKPLTGVDDLDGSSPDNIVNRISPNATGARGYGGIQLELSSTLRNDTALFHEFMRALAFALDGQIKLNPVSNYCAQYE